MLKYIFCSLCVNNKKCQTYYNGFEEKGAQLVKTTCVANTLCRHSAPLPSSGERLLLITQIRDYPNIYVRYCEDDSKFYII